MFSVGQRAAVHGAFQLAGVESPLMTGRIASEDERLFVLDSADYVRIRHLRALEQVLQQLLDRKVWIVDRTDYRWEIIPFD